MANIKLVRVDFRLIHGQIITKWRAVFEINKIVVVDNILAADDFMIRVYSTSAPAGTTIKVYSEEKALRIWNKNQFGNADILILFKDIDTCYRVIKAGIPIEKVQLGGVPHSSSRKLIKKAVSLSNNEMDMLKELHDDNSIDFTIQVVPEDSCMEYHEIVKTYEKQKEE